MNLIMSTSSQAGWSSEQEPLKPEEEPPTFLFINFIAFWSRSDPNSSIKHGLLRLKPFWSSSRGHSIRSRKQFITDGSNPLRLRLGRRSCSRPGRPAVHGASPLSSGRNSTPKKGGEDGDHTPGEVSLVPPPLAPHRRENATFGH